MAKTPTTNKKAIKEPRKLQTGEYRSFRLQKKLKTGDTKVPGVFKLLKGSLGIVRRSWKVFLGIMLIYGLLNVVLVQSFSNEDLSRTKDVLDGMSSDSILGSLGASVVLFVYLSASSGNLNSEVAGAYQLMLTITTSLALIWALREAYAEKKFRVREAFYRGMYPLVPFVLILMIASLQLLPVVFGGYIYNLVSTTGIASPGVETLLWLVVFFLLGTLSFYMLSATIFALYIVCLPNMTPMAALRSAQQLVYLRRWTVMRKIIFLPIFLLVCSMVIVVPLIYI
ncbi:MAG TPA: hypothetical protein VFM05_09095, partial [Candidatus Saccharimonadales bacterium]|nr:hypothetical protein [Candidatus Saccharimonadales bacterium]